MRPASSGHTYSLAGLPVLTSDASISLFRFRYDIETILSKYRDVDIDIVIIKIYNLMLQHYSVDFFYLIILKLYYFTCIILIRKVITISEITI